MAAKNEQKRLSGTVETIDIDPDTGRILGDEDVDTSGLENDQDKLLEDIIGEFGAGDNEVSYSASVTRIPKNFQRGQKEPWLFEADAADIIGIRTKLRDVYRGGQFRIRVYKTTSRGKKLYRQMDYFIEAPESVAAATGDTKYDALSAALERTQQQLLTLADRLSNPVVQANQVPVDPFLQMERLSTIMKNMREPRDERQHDNSFTTKDAMDIFTKGMELAESMRGDGSDSWTGVFKELIRNAPIGDIMKNLSELQAQRNNPQRRQLPPPQHQPQQNFRSNPIPQQPQNNPVSPDSAAATGEQLQQSMRYLIGRAQKNSDPGLYAEWLLDNAPRELIRQMANDPNVLVQLATIFPALNQPLINGWFVELVEATKEALAQNPEMGDNDAGIASQSANGNAFNGGGSHAPDPGRNSGHQDNPENHAGVGQTGQA